MAQPQPQPAPAAQPVVWTRGRLLMILAAALFTIAALSFAFSGVNNDLGPGFAWLAGGFAATALSWALP